MEYRGLLNLSVLGDTIVVPIVVIHKELESGVEVVIKIEFQERTYVGTGKNIEWTDAFANLQKTLPDGVKIQCCMTCRHGTLCPYGNIPDYILCSKNAEINNKDDVIDWFDKVDDVTKIEKSSFCCCETYNASNENNYTYNDYLYYLNH